jgi:hypothetical protein
LIHIANATIGFRYFASCGDDSATYVGTDASTTNLNTYCQCDYSKTEQTSYLDLSTTAYCQRTTSSLPVLAASLTTSSPSMTISSVKAPFSSYLLYNISIPPSALLKGLDLTINFTADPATCPGTLPLT